MAGKIKGFPVRVLRWWNFRDYVSHGVEEVARFANMRDAQDYLSDQWNAHKGDTVPENIKSVKARHYTIIDARGYRSGMYFPEVPGDLVNEFLAGSGNGVKMGAGGRAQ